MPLCVAKPMKMIRRRPRLVFEDQHEDDSHPRFMKQVCSRCHGIERPKTETQKARIRLKIGDA
jgi:hypothetical protein